MVINMVTTQPGKRLLSQANSLSVGRSSYDRETLRPQTQDGDLTYGGLPRRH